MSGGEIFSTILGSTVHDIKTSLGTLLGLIQHLSLSQTPQQQDDIRQLEFEANRINHSLMQLLVIYKIDSHKFSLIVDEYPVIDLINEAKSQQIGFLQQNTVDIRVSCSEELMGYCDYQQVTNAIGNILNNALRYMRQSVLISAFEEAGYLKICIEDDGEGYPERLLNADLTKPSELDWVSGNTGLGLYFVAAIAGFHKNRDKAGFVKIDNQSRLGGARFCLFLP
ncbi:MAG: HAMP domain-containing sensor histidine kinase [Methylomonas sp.]|nr:HAMP domain-containing sensor histidine kinase [Methylomonas sp.]